MECPCRSGPCCRSSDPDCQCLLPCSSGNVGPPWAPTIAFIQITHVCSIMRASSARPFAPSNPPNHASGDCQTLKRKSFEWSCKWAAACSRRVEPERTTSESRRRIARPTFPNPNPNPNPTIASTSHCSVGVTIIYVNQAITGSHCPLPHHPKAARGRGGGQHSEAAGARQAAARPAS